NFASKPDPSDGRPYTSVQKLMTSHLQTNLPEQSETIFSIVDGKEDQRSVDNPPVRLDKDREFVARAAQVTTPQTGELDTDSGRVRSEEHTSELQSRFD